MDLEKIIILSANFILFGIVPIGLFLTEHLLVNSSSLSPNVTTRLSPYCKNTLLIQELFITIHPIVFHALYGIWMPMWPNNVLQYHYYRNWFFFTESNGHNHPHLRCLSRLYCASPNPRIGNQLSTMSAVLPIPGFLLFILLAWWLRLSFRNGLATFDHLGYYCWSFFPKGSCSYVRIIFVALSFWNTISHCFHVEEEEMAEQNVVNGGGLAGLMATLKIA